MNKLILSILLTSTLSNDLIGMNQEKQSFFPAEVESLIIFHALNDTHIHNQTHQDARNHIQKISVLNKHSYALANDPAFVRNIIGNLSNNDDHSTVAAVIATSAAKNYLFRNMLLHQGLANGYDCKMKKRGSMSIPEFIPIITLDAKTIKELIGTGADINCKSATGQHPLLHAIQAENTELTELFLSYKPHTIYFADAIKTGNPDIIKLCFKQGVGVTFNELNKALEVAINTEQANIVRLLLDAGADPSFHLHSTVVRSIAQALDWFFNTEDPAPNLEIINIMCLYGAYDANATELAHVMNECPQELKDSLEMGRLVALEKLDPDYGSNN